MQAANHRLMKPSAVTRMKGVRGVRTAWKSASERLWLAAATAFMASTSGPAYFSASLPLTMPFTSSGLRRDEELLSDTGNRSRTPTKGHEPGNVCNSCNGTVKKYQY